MNNSPRSRTDALPAPYRYDASAVRLDDAGAAGSWSSRWPRSSLRVLVLLADAIGLTQLQAIKHARPHAGVGLYQGGGTNHSS